VHTEYAIDKERQIIDDFIFWVEHFALQYDHKPYMKTTVS
jgi:hypothetical protein